MACLIENVSFAIARKNQFALLVSWLKKPYIHRFWGDGGLTIPDFKNFTAKESSIFEHFFAYYKDQPFAFFMTSKIQDGEEFAVWKDPEEIAISLDWMIGEEEFVGQGWAHTIIEKFLKDKYSYVSVVITDPEATNKRAIRVYEKAGFVKVGEYFPKEGNWSSLPHIILRRRSKAKLDQNYK